MLSDTSVGPEPSYGASQATSNGTRRSQRTPVAGSSNGTVKHGTDTLNESALNGKGPARPRLPSTYMGHNTGEMTRLLMQALSDMGYQEAAESVSKDSGIELEHPTVAAFRAAVLDGGWHRAEALLDGAVLAGEDQRKGNGLILSSAAEPERKRMKFLLKQQKYLELLEQQESARALLVLRNELAPLCEEKPLHTLASLLMCQSPDDLRVKAKWDGAGGQSRQELLSELSKNVSPSVMLPEHRLAVLLQQVKEHQISTCLYHTNPEPPSLYADHFCAKSRFPMETVYELDDHTGEVWQVQFSHDGSKMASCGKDRYVIIWKVPSFEVMHRLDAVPNFDTNHEDSGVGAVAWSPDDTILVTCGRDHHANLWDVETGTRRTQYEAFREPVTSCVWAPDGESIILGSMDKERALCQWNLDGTRLFNWTTKHRVEDIAISPDGQWLVGMAYGNRLLVYNYMTRDLEDELCLDARPSSISISQDSQFLLVNKEDGEAQLIHLSSGEKPVRYTGHTGGLYQIRSAFGGANESYVLSGSEDGNILIWHKWTGRQVLKLPGHSPRTNGVWWNPTDTCMFASCGDDGKIKIWSNSEFSRRLAGAARKHSNGVGSASPNDNSNGEGSRASNGFHPAELEGEI